MIKILPLKDTKILAQLNSKENLNAALAFCLYTGEQTEIDGYALYNITGECGEILVVRAEDDDMLDGLVRSVLASLYDFGINKAMFAGGMDICLLQKLRILKPNEAQINSIKSILYHCEECEGCL